jgi:hypothetical protein
VDDGAERHAQDGRPALAAVAIRALAVLAALAVPVRLELEVDEVVLVVVTAQDHVAAVGTAPGLVFLAAEAGAAAAAVARARLDGGFVDKHGSGKLKVGCEELRE